VCVLAGLLIPGGRRRGRALQLDAPLAYSQEAG
jgi:hypothetical protein